MPLLGRAEVSYQKYLFPYFAQRFLRHKGKRTLQFYAQASSPQTEARQPPRPPVLPARGKAEGLRQLLYFAFSGSNIAAAWPWLAVQAPHGHPPPPKTWLQVCPKEARCECAPPPPPPPQQAGWSAAGGNARLLVNAIPSRHQPPALASTLSWGSEVRCTGHSLCAKDGAREWQTLCQSLPIMSASSEDAPAGPRDGSVRTPSGSWAP